MEGLISLGLVSGAGGGGLVSKSLRYLNMLLHD